MPAATGLGPHLQPRLSSTIPLLALACASFGGGCGSSPSGPDPFRGVDAAERYAEATPARRISALPDTPPLSIDSEPVDWSVLAPRLAEAAGGVVVEELALEHLLGRELTRRGLAITDADLARERAWLAASVAEAGQVGEADSGQLITQVRQRRGLGPVRFEALLRRNASLRALVADRVEVGDDQVELAWRVQHGPRVRVRVITTASHSKAQQLLDQAAAAPPDQTRVRFAELALDHSTDPSGPRGGLIEVFSVADPAYEQPIRMAAQSLAPGQLSPVIALGSGFALLYLEELLPPDGVTLDAAREALTEQLRRRQERLLMDQLATQLLAEARVRVIDESLNWSVQAGQSP